eukprot:3940890-Rhodomonas_salina.1
MDLKSAQDGYGLEKIDATSGVSSESASLHVKSHFSVSSSRVTPVSLRVKSHACRCGSPAPVAARGRFEGGHSPGSTIRWLSTTYRVVPYAGSVPHNAYHHTLAQYHTTHCLRAHRTIGAPTHVVEEITPAPGSSIRGMQHTLGQYQIWGRRVPTAQYRAWGRMIPATSAQYD